MRTRRLTYLRTITRRDSGGLPVIRPPNALLRRWEMTASGWQGLEPPIRSVEHAAVTTAPSRLPNQPHELPRADADLHVEPMEINQPPHSSTPPVREVKQTTAKQVTAEQAVVRDEGTERASRQSVE